MLRTLLFLAGFLFLQVCSEKEYNMWSKQTKCEKKKAGVCVKKVPGSKCPFKGGGVTPWGCPKGYLCCTPNPLKRTRALIEGDCGLPPLSKGGSRTRIVGGYAVKLGELPWQALLRVVNPFGDDFHPDKPFCGGTIIHESWILTAAHCFGPKSPIHVGDASDLRVVTGVVKSENSALNKTKHGQVHKVKRIILHRRYNPNTEINDIALLKLAKPIRFDDYSWPVCLPKQKENFENTICTVSGWGVYNNTINMGSEFLRALNIPTITTSTCKKIHHEKDVENVIFPTNICTLFVASGRDSCRGDSGGPLACRMNSGQYILGGVVSWGDLDGCALKNLPGVYTQVSDYVNWIERHTHVDFPE